MDKKKNTSAESFLFWTVVLLDLFYYVYLILSKRLSLGHDGFADLTTAYYFLNGVVSHGEIPQWVPFLTHGTNATSLFIVHNASGIFLDVLMLFGAFLKHVNFLPLFYLGLFVDELLLVVGVWLLAKRFFQSPMTIFLVTSAAVFSAVPVTDINYTLRIYYAIPLILFFLHQFIDTSRWRYAFLAVYLFAFQLLTTSLYFIPISTLTIAGYFIFYAMFNWEHTFSALKKLAWNKSFFWIFLSGACLLFTFLFIQSAERGSLALYAVERNADSSVSLKTFLTYGGRIDLSKFRELFLRSSKELEITLYAGLLTLTLMTLSIFTAIRRRNAHFYALSVLLMLLSSGTIIAGWLYHVWPLMKYYRHIGMVDVVTKLLFCFMAGFGFEAFFLRRLSLPPKIFAAISSVVALGLVGAHFGILSMIHKYPQPFRLEESSLYVLLYAALFFIFGFLKKENHQKLFLILLLLTHTVDTYSYKVTEGILRSFVLTQKQYEVFNFCPVVYTKRRGEMPLSVKAREIILDTPAGREVDQRAMYWKLDAFLFRDPLMHDFRVDHALKNFDQYLRAVTSGDLSDKNFMKRYFDRNKMIFPHRESAYPLSGKSEEKIQLFSNAYALDEDQTAKILYDENFRGGMIFLTGTDAKYNLAPFSSEISLGRNERIIFDYKIIKFSPNQLDILVDVPDGHDKAFLYYSDLWHRRWQAFVNGREVPVFQANLAYKTVALDPGQNKVTFRFFSLYVALLYLINNLNALFWLGMIIYWMVFINRAKPLVRPQIT